VDDGYLNLDAAKGIKWGSVLKIYSSGGDIVIDDGVQITGALDVTGALSMGSVTGNLNVVGDIDSTGTLTVDTIDDSGGATIDILEDIVLAVGKDITCQRATLNSLYVRTNAYIYSADSMEFAGGKYIDITTLKADIIDDSGASEITFLEDIYISTGKTITVGTAPNYTVSNELVDRVFDANTVAIAELADVVGTMINDLITIGLFQ